MVNISNNHEKHARLCGVEAGKGQKGNRWNSLARAGKQELKTSEDGRD
jgi:hypothetical protein